MRSLPIRSGGPHVRLEQIHNSNCVGFQNQSVIPRTTSFQRNDEFLPSFIMSGFIHDVHKSLSEITPSIQPESLPLTRLVDQNHGILLSLCCKPGLGIDGTAFLGAATARMMTLGSSSYQRHHVTSVHYDFITKPKVLHVEFQRPVAGLPFPVVQFVMDTPGNCKFGMPHSGMAGQPQNWDEPTASIPCVDSSDKTMVKTPATMLK
jgi:hypothetical protein